MRLIGVLVLTWLVMLGFGLFVICTPARAQEARREYMRITWYSEPGRMADGAPVHRDAAACSSWLPFGTQLMLPDGYVVTCQDRGLGDRYWSAWVDVWAPSRDWGQRNVSQAYGDYNWVTVVRWGWDE